MSRAMKFLGRLPGFASRLARERERAEMSQRTLALEVGITPAYVSRLERAERQPTGQLVEALAEAIGTSSRYLISGVRDPLELGVGDAGLWLGELTKEQRAALRAVADEAVRTAVARAAADLSRNGEKHTPT